MFMAIVCDAFFARVNPVSQKANPACMNITRNPASSIQTKLLAIFAWPTSVASSSNVGPDVFAATTSEALPVSEPVGSPAMATRGVVSKSMHAITHTLTMRFTPQNLLLAVTTFMPKRFFATNLRGSASQRRSVADNFVGLSVEAYKNVRSVYVAIKLFTLTCRTVRFNMLRIMVATERIVKSKTPELISRERREVRKLSTLLEIGRILADASNLKTAFAATLETV